MTIDQIVGKIVDQGALGALLVVAVFLFWRMTDRYLVALEKLTSLQGAERNERDSSQLIEHNSWLLTISKHIDALREHSDVSKELHKLTIDHDRRERETSTKVLEHLSEMTQWLKEQHEQQQNQRSTERAR